MRRGRVLRLEVQHDARFGVRRVRPDRLHAERMRHQQMVRRGERRLRFGAPGRVRAHPVSVIGDDVGLVERREMADAVAEPAGHERGVLTERVRGRPRGPAAGVLQRLGQVPVVQRHEGVDVVREQLVDQPVVEVEARFVRPADALGEHARPGHRQAIAAEPEVGHQLDVLAIPVVVVARDVAGVAVPYAPRRVGEAIPDALAAPVVPGRALDLIGRGRGSPHELGRELSFRHGAPSWERFHDDRCNVHLTWSLRTPLTDPEQPLG